jgi:hypothetical protein
VQMRSQLRQRAILDRRQVQRLAGAPHRAARRIDLHVAEFHHGSALSRAVAATPQVCAQGLG